MLEKQRREEHSPPLRAALAYLIGEEVHITLASLCPNFPSLLPTPSPYRYTRVVSIALRGGFELIDALPAAVCPNWGLQVPDVGDMDNESARVRKFKKSALKGFSETRSATYR